jgi:hypothetical protein
MGKVIIHNQVTVNGAFEAATPYRSGVVWLRYRPAAV